MIKNLQKLSFFLWLVAGSSAAAQVKSYKITSPNERITATFTLNANGEPSYTISRNQVQALESSKLGLVRTDGDYSRNLKLVSASRLEGIAGQYETLVGKRRVNRYSANQQVFHLSNSAGKALDIIFRVSNDGVAFRYYFPGQSTDLKQITNELTSFNFPERARGWLQPMADAQTGWERSNPSYEENYEQGIPVGKKSPIRAGWVFPALFQNGDTWVLITESASEGNYAGTRLKPDSPSGEYSIGFPQSPEVFAPQAALLPESKLPWYTPWRIIALGSLKTITESTLGTDLAKPALETDLSYIKPGKAAWSWVLMKDDSTVYHVQKRFVDYAADMNWEYCLVDAEWDKRIGYEKIAELSDYAQSKKVGLILWYNSAGAWNSTPYTPRNLMLTRESRRAEFARLQKMGIKGVKIDFFGGDGQSFMQYYQDILKDAADHKILVNFHGATLPRGLQHTYPNLMTMESVKGMEFRTFAQETEDMQPAHCTTIPFTRNVFDPMDYTPMVLHKIPNIKRKTSNGFELALPILFTSGIQHMAETPEGMAHVPEYVKQHLRNLPSTWDDVRFIDGFPGKRAVIARKSGNKWYVAGINGERTEKELTLDLSFIPGKGKMITDGREEFSFAQAEVLPSRTTSVKVKGAGGFVMVFE
ncbi:glycosyl hydrolase family 97 [Arcticibacter pallidicorallinus]|uniref:Glycosyl hydrolase family 97 n=1 Tax=Arcticibacter pallidicorallinus TaxID=1259464 RepID=A0A2T0TSG7_9SPHI|nr:glycoside hydrolase family 97 protein [Arcticibacter pallidicorallinus]PRY48597.1 glycosyl hydrolase family 97 [Arcticibacter pallidicorallinus]